jgi:hypothetical protein
MSPRQPDQSAVWSEATETKDTLSGGAFLRVSASIANVFGSQRLTASSIPIRDVISSLQRRTEYIVSRFI